MTLSAQRLLALASILHTSTALVEFSKSKLFDETDFSIQTVNIPNYCDVGCRIYASVPESSAEIAKLIVVHDYVNPETSLYDIAKKKNGNRKGFLSVEIGNAQVNILNQNAGLATAPIALWIVRGDAVNIGEGIVYEAAALRLEPASLGVVTVMSAEPFTLRTKTDGPMILVSTMSGYDSVNAESDDECANVIEKFNVAAPSDVQAYVQSPLISFFFDDIDYLTTMTSLDAIVGKDKLDFSGISFATSPGYIGCKGGKTYRSSLYTADTSFKFTNFERLYDVSLSAVLTTDVDHPVTIRDNFNGNEYICSAGGADCDLTVQQTNSLDISWTRNDAALDQSFLVRLVPANEQVHTTIGPDTTSDGTTEPAERTTTTPGDVDPEDPVRSTTTLTPDGPEDPDHTDGPPPPKTTRRTLPPTSSTPHPKDVSSTSTLRPSTSPTRGTTTTSGVASYGSTLTALAVASVFLL